MVPRALRASAPSLARIPGRKAESTGTHPPYWVGSLLPAAEWASPCMLVLSLYHFSHFTM